MIQQNKFKILTLAHIRNKPIVILENGYGNIAPDDILLDTTGHEWQVVSLLRADLAQITGENRNQGVVLKGLNDSGLIEGEFMTKKGTYESKNSFIQTTV